MRQEPKIYNTQAQKVIRETVEIETQSGIIKTKGKKVIKKLPVKDILISGSVSGHKPKDAVYFFKCRNKKN